MSKSDILAKRSNSAYQVSMTLGGTDIIIKLDTGAKFTVISAKMFDDSLSPDDLTQLQTYCEAHSKIKEQFISASGHSFWGYLVTAHDVKMGNALLKDFHYYLVIDNPRDIALLGFDFIDNCTDFHTSHGDIVISGFDTAAYGKPHGAIESDDVMAFIDSFPEDGE